LKKGAAGFAVIKASEVMISTQMDGVKLSARNVLAGVVSKMPASAVNSEVILTLPGGSEVVASITNARANSQVVETVTGADGHPGLLVDS
jgi:molybdate transport system regulatory protein